MIRIATALLVRDGLLLMVHRHPARQAYPDRWALPGGHLEPGESPRQAVIRECLEELGVQLHEPRPIPMTIDNPGLTSYAFLSTRWTGEPVNTAPDEHDDLRWFEPGELASLQLAHPETLPSLLDAIRHTSQGPSRSS